MIVADTNWQPDLSGAGRAKYKALSEAIRSGIVSGQLGAGAQLPPVRELAYRINVTPGTVARAYALLVDEGRLVAGVGRGTFVAEPARPAGIARGDESLLYVVDEEMADFRSGRVPDVGQAAVIDAAFVRLGQSGRSRHINYPTAETDRSARAAVARWIDPARIGQIGPDDIVLGNGAQNCVLLALQAVLRGAHPVILAEELGYPGVRHAARLLRAEVVPVAMDDQGLIPEALEVAYRARGGQVLLTSPGVHSPTASQTGLARKQALAKTIERLGLQVIEDDCYGIAPSDVPTYRALMDGRAYYISSLTKSVSGALRFGYMVGAEGETAALRQVAQSSFYGVSQPILDVCTDLLTSGAAARIRDDVVAFTARRVRMAVNILGRWDISWSEDAPFIWLRMPTGWRASSFAMACAREGVRVRPGDEFSLAGVAAPNAVRLAVTTCAQDMAFEAALGRMNDLLSQPAPAMDA